MHLVAFKRVGCSRNGYRNADLELCRLQCNAMSALKSETDDLSFEVSLVSTSERRVYVSMCPCVCVRSCAYASVCERHTCFERTLASTQLPVEVQEVNVCTQTSVKLLPTCLLSLSLSLYSFERQTGKLSLV